jgi:flagellar protein FlgJ
VKPATVTHLKNDEVSPDPREQKHTPQYSNPVELEPTGFSSPEDFVKKLWTTANIAAGILGVHPEILLAQAALETNWGKSILQHSNGRSTHNLFNIKAGNDWNKDTTSINSVEQKQGVLVKEKSTFRSYSSFTDSFFDFVNLLKQNGRYSDVLNKVSDPRQFIQALQKAGYATDQNYADKILKIFSSPMFQNLVSKVKNNDYPYPFAMGDV